MSRQQTNHLIILLACAIGFLVALAAIILQIVVDYLGKWRLALAQQFPPLIILPIFGLILALLAGVIIQLFAPEAKGSGIPDVKAAAAGLPRKLNLKIALLKIVSSSLALASGLALGREGPTIEIGAALALEVKKFFPNIASLHKQIIAAGGGAGLAAALNAPLTGILFMIEELLKTVNYPIIPFGIFATFIAGMFTRIWENKILNIDLEAASYLQNITDFGWREMPFFILLGILAGLAGCIFNQGILLSLKVAQNVNFPQKMALAGLVTGLIVACLPDIFRNNAGLVDFVTLGQESLSLAILVLIAYFILIMIASGSGAPGGVLIPLLVLGATLGVIVGKIATFSLGITHLTTYALVGMGAFFCGAIRVPLAAISLILEINQDFKILLPLMLAVIIAHLVGEKIYPGSLYDLILQEEGINLIAAETEENQ